VNHLTADVGESEVAALKAVSELEMVQAKLMQHRGVQIVDVHLVLGHVPADIIGGSVNLAAFDSARPSSC
jgi:hypothetical protein